MSKVDKSDIKEEVAASVKKFSMLAKDEAARQRYIIEMPEFIQKKASLISAHFLLPAGSRIVDMGCETGEISYMLAVLNPRVEIIGVDSDAKCIDFARKTYRLPNLSFRQSDISIPDLDDESVDGIINSNMLHHVYSAGGYNPDEVTQLLEKQIQKLKPGGTMLVRDYVMPPEDEYVFLELPNVPSTGSDPVSMSDADLLVSFSQTARPMVSGCEGFFIEEQMPRREGTRLFRLQHKWAKEFIHRKNYRAHWNRELKEEYTFFTWADYRREFARLGLRMVFSAPYWNPWVVQNCFKGRFQMYDAAYKPLNPPPTNYFIVGQKVADKQSLVIEERRPSQKPVGDLQIMVVRDKKSGALHELVKRPGEYCDVVPFRITPDNRLVIYVRSGYPRPIVNAVNRGSYNLDGKKWSGHLVEPITMDTVSMTDDVEENRRMIFGFTENYAGLRPKGEDRWYVGDTYFPSPDRIDEAIEPVFIEVENPQKTTWPIREDKDVNFTEIGTITELDGADIILAAQVGLLPEPRLEMHVFELMSRYGIAFPRWIGEGMPKIEKQHVPTVEPEELLKEVEPGEFEQENRAPVTLRPVKAVFVEEGKVGKATRGLSAQDIEFIVTDDGIENIAVVLPVSRDWDDNLLVSLDPKILPVPNRMGGDGAMLNAPSFVLPKDIRTVDDARQFIADKFNVKVELVSQLGESYFTHTGVTPQRVYPFIIAATGELSRLMHRKFTHLRSLWRMLRFSRFSGDLIKLIARVHMAADYNHDMQLNRDTVSLRNKGYQLSTEKIAVEAKNASYSAVPSRVLGQRAAGGGGGGPSAAAKPDDYQPYQPPQEADPQLLEQSKAAQALIESIVSPRIGRRLVDSYSQAKRLLKGEPIQMKETPSITAVDKDIGDVGAQLKTMKPPVMRPPTLELKPPKAAKAADPGSKGDR